MRAYGEDREGRGWISGYPEAVGLDEEVVLPSLGEAGVAVAQGGALGAPGAELAADEGGQGERRRRRKTSLRRHGWPHQPTYLSPALGPSNNW